MERKLSRQMSIGFNGADTMILTHDKIVPLMEAKIKDMEVLCLEQDALIIIAKYFKWNVDVI